MKILLAFLTKNSFVFLFFFLELLAFFLLIGNNSYQYSSVFNSSNFLVGNLYETTNDFKKYLSLSEVNVELAEYNAELREQNIQAYTKTYGQSVLVNDTSYFQRYSYTAAQVINNSVNRRKNYITLDKGALNGIEAGMGVITSNGIVGIVKNVSAHFSSVMSVLHQESKISAKVKTTGHFGSLVWNDTQYRFATLEDIPNHVALQIGDTVVTSGYSSIFPAGIDVGRITSFKLIEGSNFYKIQVAFFDDYKKLMHVYVVKSLFKEEQQELEKTDKGSV